MSELEDVQTTVAVIDGLRSRIAELEAESDRRFDELTRCRELLNQAEARYSDVVAEHENELALRLEAEAELAQRDRMLRHFLQRYLYWSPEQMRRTSEELWADLRARAEEGRE
jgi:hypothetical protein